MLFSRHRKCQHSTHTMTTCWSAQHICILGLRCSKIQVSKNEISLSRLQAIFQIQQRLGYTTEAFTNAFTNTWNQVRILQDWLKPLTTSVLACSSPFSAFHWFKSRLWKELASLWEFTLVYCLIPLGPLAFPAGGEEQSPVEGNRAPWRAATEASRTMKEKVGMP